MRRHELEQAVIEAAEICVDTGGTQMMGLIRAVRALRAHQLQMPTGAPVSDKHPVTSRLAAQWMEAEHPDLCAKVFRTIWGNQPHGMTTDEVQRWMGGTHQSISPRITQLRDEGWIFDSGTKRPTGSGRLAIVWKPTVAATHAMTAERVRTYDRDGVPHDDVLRTNSGRVLTEQQILQFAEEDGRGQPI